MASIALSRDNDESRSYEIIDDGEGTFVTRATRDVSDAAHVVGASRIPLAKVDADERDNRQPRKRNEMFLMNENAMRAHVCVTRDE